MSQDEYPNVKPLSLTGKNISTLGRHFIDQHGRIIHLRGANVSASSKVPNDPKPLIHDHALSNYVNRPFPLSEAAEHWKRLRSWGLTFVRITVTWDAIEHAGPGQYDEDYLTYLRDLLASMKEFGLVCYVAIHQDVWSRYTGGSGAPGWTLTKAGFDLSNDGENLVRSGAAFLDGIRGGRLEGERGLWPTGYQKLAAASMNTFFWAGETFVPKLKVDTPNGSRNIQTFLQDSFLKATEKLVNTVGNLDTVLGFELLNEPHPGFIGLATINEWNYNTDLHLGDFPSPLQSFSMGAGYKTSRIPHYKRSFPFPTRIDRYVDGNPTQTSAWTGPCPWEEAGAWRWSEEKSKPVSLQDDFFTKDAKGRKIDFYKDFYWPFVRRWEGVVNKAGGKGKAKMIEVIPNEYCPEWPLEARPDRLVYAPHWYDLNVLFKKQFGNFTVNVQGLSRGMSILNAIYWGKRVKDNYRLQIRNIVQNARRQLGDVPIVFGECGVPMDLNNEEALRTGDWKWQERMMDAMISAFESNLVGFNLWNYNPSNRDDTGDDWNAENFSWYSSDNREKNPAAKVGEHDLDAGSRLLDAIVRPYPIATAGTLTAMSYRMDICHFTLRYRSPTNILPKGVETYNPTQTEITEIFLPKRTYRSVEELICIMSPGGNIKIDLDNSRAYVWWVDTLLSANGKSERPRRVDIWVKAKAEKGGNAFLIKLVAVFIVVIFAIYVGWHAQYQQWAMEEALGIKVAKGWW